MTNDEWPHSSRTRGRVWSDEISAELVRSRCHPGQCGREAGDRPGDSLSSSSSRRAKRPARFPMVARNADPCFNPSRCGTAGANGLGSSCTFRTSRRGFTASSGRLCRCLVRIGPRGCSSGPVTAVTICPMAFRGPIVQIDFIPKIVSTDIDSDRRATGRWGSNHD